LSQLAQVSLFPSIKDEEAAPWTYHTPTTSSMSLFLPE